MVRSARVLYRLPEPAQPEPTRTKRGDRMFPPPAPVRWDVAVRLGAAIRAGRARTESEEAAERASGVRPHIRRAHWHLYWTGPRTSERVPRLHWLPPIPVNVEGGIVPTVREVATD